MNAPGSFKDLKALFGELDDLSQERRRVYTDWGTGRIPPEEFGSRMKENLRRTREAATTLERLLSQPG